MSHQRTFFQHSLLWAFTLDKNRPQKLLEQNQNTQKFLTLLDPEFNEVDDA
jgi:hypothetical protein